MPVQQAVFTGYGKKQQTWLALRFNAKDMPIKIFSQRCASGKSRSGKQRRIHCIFSLEVSGFNQRHTETKRFFSESAPFPARRGGCGARAFSNATCAHGDCPYVGTCSITKCVQCRGKVEEGFVFCAEPLPRPTAPLRTALRPRAWTGPPAAPQP